MFENPIARFARLYAREIYREIRETLKRERKVSADFAGYTRGEKNLVKLSVRISIRTFRTLYARKKHGKTWCCEPIKT